MSHFFDMEKYTPVTVSSGTTPTPSAIIEARAKTHGDWNEVARVCNGIKTLYRSGPSWVSMTPSQQEAMDMKAMKQARIVCGNPHEQDHWVDDSNYALLGMGK